MTLLIAIAILLVVLGLFIERKLPLLIGRSGERFVAKRLSQLGSINYRVLNDLLLPSNGSLAATQIDHVVISDFGIFCIETKAYSGWIFGNAKDEYWTQVIYRHKERIYNPLRQNYAHVKAIEELILTRYPKAQIISLVAFPNAEKLKISGTDLVGYTRDVIRKIKSFDRPILFDSEKDEIYEILAHTNVLDEEARKAHIKGVKELNRA